MFYATSWVWTKVCSTFECKVLSKTVLSRNAVVVLTLQRPAAFKFTAGQSANLRIRDIDNFAHPFSIASSPASSSLVFIIEVAAQESWTAKLASAPPGTISTVIVSGPFGCPVTNSQDADEVLAIGTGTGVVPMLSLFARRAQHLAKLSTGALVNECDGIDLALRQMHVVPRSPEAIRAHKVQMKYRLDQLHAKGRNSAYFRSLFRRSRRQCGWLVADIISWSLALLEMSVLALALSWGNLPTGVHEQFGEYFIDTIPSCTAFFLFLYLCNFIFRAVNPAIYPRSCWTAIDLVVLIAAVATLSYWWFTDRDSYLRPTGVQQICRTLFSLWRTAKLLLHRALNKAARPGQDKQKNLLGTKSFTMIWVTHDGNVWRWVGRGWGGGHVLDDPVQVSAAFNMILHHVSI